MYITCLLSTGGYNINDVMFYWTRGNDSVRGLNTLRLAQYTVEDHYTSVSEAVYETGKSSNVIHTASNSLTSNRDENTFR